MFRINNLATIVAILIITSCTTTKKDNYTQYANPFVGTAENGHCSPCACVPFGLIQAGPETGNGSWAYCAGYQYSDSILNGFSQNRLNGTGCHDLGDLLILPFTGNAVRDTYKSKFDKSKEKASPGYYSVYLSDFEIKTEISSTEHAAFYHCTFKGTGKPHLLIDFQSNITGNLEQLKNHILKSHIYQENDSIISGDTRTKVWVDRTYYYVIKFSQPIDGKTKLKKRDPAEKAPRYVYDFNLKKGDDLLIKIALSSTSIEGAKKNMQTEIPDWNFNKIKKQANSKWNTLLSKIQIQGTKEEKDIFYTSMYHLFIQPNNIADAGSEPFYSTFSLWDTFRAAHPLYTIIAPERVNGFIKSMLNQYDNQGFLPIWALWGKENYCMIGNHAVPVVVDAYLKGFRGFDKQKAYNAVKTSLTINHRNSPWNIYDKYHYFPFDSIKNESVSKTLECGYDDYCAAMFAKNLNKNEDYNFFINRSKYYKNLFDSQLKIMRGKDTKRNWRAPFLPFSLSHASSSGGDYTEGNAWQYSWHVLQDIPGLIKLMGGEKEFNTKLDSLFTMSDKKEGAGWVSDVTGLIGQYAHGNEPSHHVAYLYAVANNPDKTAKLIHKICQTEYQDKIDGLCGNDDCGQMSAWYIFSCMGFYPVNPCGGKFVIGAPQISEAKIALPKNKNFTIKAENISQKNIYVRSKTLNGKKYEKSTISYKDIMNGGTLVFQMTNKKTKL